VLIFIPARSHAVEDRSSSCWRPCWEDASSTKSSEKSCSSQLWHPRRHGCDCLQQWFVMVRGGKHPTVVVNKFPGGERALTRPTKCKI